MPYQNLREFLQLLESKGLLRRVQKEVDWNLEMCHVSKLNEIEGGPALLFENVRDCPGKRVAFSVLSTKEKLALALEVDPGRRFLDISHTWVSRISGRKVPPEWVDWCLWNDNVLTGDDVDLYQLPVLKFYPEDGGRYLGTAGCFITRNLETGRINIGTYRGMVVDRNRMTFYPVVGRDAEMDLRGYAKIGQPMPVAWVTGVDPALLLCSSSHVAPDLSEYEVAGALRGEPIDVTRGSVVDLPIPAAAEIVIEGHVMPGDVHPEGPFGEHSGYYRASPGPQPCITVRAISHRNNPILWATTVGMPITDTHMLVSMSSTASLWNDIQNMRIPGIKGIYCPPAGGGRMMAVISLEQMYPGHSTQAGLAAFGCHAGNFGLKVVIVVDSDIDPENWDQVLYAVGYRYQPERGTQTMRRGRASAVEISLPPGENLLTSRLLIDACIPYEWEEKMKQVVLDQELVNKIRGQWAQYFAPDSSQAKQKKRRKRGEDK
jgi:phenylphosphate carboxylase beta subunit